MRSSAALPSAGSAWPATHFAPSTAASISSGVSISGGRSKPLLQHIAHAGLAADRHALADQGGDIAIDRAFGGLQFRRDSVGRGRRAGAAQDLDDLKQPVGSAH